MSPQEAQSSLAAWAELLGFDGFAELISPGVNDIIFWVAVVLFVVSVIWYWHSDLKGAREYYGNR